MKRILPFILLLIAFTSKAQIISQFTWDTNPVTKSCSWTKRSFEQC
ncbi:MAG: hypothetical protein IPP79_06955 [Chitinophagaceae bacterium]|nr:hypothetical protein [Chitinophagaceae bacterium]